MRVSPAPDAVLQSCSLASVHDDLNCLNAHAGFYLGAGSGEGGGTGGGRGGGDQGMFLP